MVIAPPSHGLNDTYRFIVGGLDELDRLPIMCDVPSRALSKPPIPANKIRSMPPEATINGRRNITLWEFCMRMARRCRSFDQLVDCARAFNSQFPDPIREETEVMTITKSAWGYEERGENRFGQFGAYFPVAEVVGLCRDPDAFMLLAYLRAHNGPWADFYIANGLAEKFGWGKNRLVAARQQLIDAGYVIEVRPANRQSPAIYQWP
jgi:hypothetical protein